MLRELWRKSCGYWCYLQLADPAKIGKETTNLQSLTKKLARICAHSGKVVNVNECMTRLEGIKKNAPKLRNALGQVSVFGLSQREHSISNCNPEDSPCGVDLLLLAVDMTGSKPN
jgi:hypothetical protein